MSKQETSGPAAFKPIPGYDGRYEVSRSGVVCEWTPTESTVPGTPQKLRVPLQGHVRQGASHRRYTLTDPEGNRRTLSERSLVAWAWEGEEPRRGARKGADHYATQLTEADVVSIRARLEKLGADPLVLKSIAEAFNVTPATIHAIHAGKSWTHLLGGDKADGGEEDLDQLPLFGEKPAAFEPVDPDPSRVRARPPLELWDPWPSGILIPTTLAPQRFRDELQRHLDAIPKGMKRHPIVQERPTRYCATCRHLDTRDQTCGVDGGARRPDAPPGCSMWDRETAKGEGGSQDRSEEEPPTTPITGVALDLASDPAETLAVVYHVNPEGVMTIRDSVTFPAPCSPAFVEMVRERVQSTNTLEDWRAFAADLIGRIHAARAVAEGVDL